MPNGSGRFLAAALVLAQWCAGGGLVQGLWWVDGPGWHGEGAAAAGFGVRRGGGDHGCAGWMPGTG
jgi:hypothetical protein